MSVDIQHLIDDARIGAEVRVPVVEAQHHHGIAVLRRIVGRHEQSPHRRFHSQHIKVVARYDLTRNQIALVVPLHASADLDIRQHTVEHFVLVAQVFVHRIGEIAVRVSAVRADAPRVRADILQPH